MHAHTHTQTHTQKPTREQSFEQRHGKATYVSGPTPVPVRIGGLGPSHGAGQGASKGLRKLSKGRENNSELSCAGTARTQGTLGKERETRDSGG